MLSAGSDYLAGLDSPDPFSRQDRAATQDLTQERAQSMFTADAVFPLTISFLIGSWLSL